MKICKFQSLKNYDFYMDEISSIYQTPVYRSLDNRGRKCNGFVLMEEGECVYTWSGGECFLKKGSFIYLPYDSVHRMHATTDELAFTRINFTTHFLNSEIFTFSKEPLVICRHADAAIMELSHELNDLFLDATAGFRLKAKLYELFDRVDYIISAKEENPINGVLQYIEKHFTEDIDCGKLVELSYLSQASLYRAFKKQTGMTPIEYKNYLRIKQARVMLQTKEYTVGEVAVILGFDNIYYFSRIFKAFTGISPKYRQQTEPEGLNTFRE